MRRGTSAHLASRKSGISGVIDLPWGSHLCHFYETKQDLLDLVVPYLKTGLEQREACLWVVAKSLTKQEAQHALGEIVPDLEDRLAAGALEILTHEEWYLRTGAFNMEEVVRGWHSKLRQAINRGYSGLRLTGDGSWVGRQDRANFREYESNLSRLIANQPFLILCTYALTQSRAEDILDVAWFHQMALAKRDGQLQVLEAPELKQSKAQLLRRISDRTTKLVKTKESLRRHTTEQQIADDLLVEHVHFLALSEKVARSLTESRDLATALQTCAEALVEHLDAMIVRIWIMEEQGRGLKLQASAGLASPLIDPHGRIRFGELQIARIAQTRQPHLTNNISADPEIDPEWAAKTGMVAFAGYPLIVHEDVLGAIGLFARHPLSDFTFKAIASISGAVALAIQRARAERSLLESEEHIARANAEMEATVCKRTTELREALAEMEHFSHTITHDLRRPLRAIEGYSQLLTRNGSPSKPEATVAYAQQITVSIQTMDQLISDALEYSRAAHQDLPLEPLDPAVVIHSIISSGPEFQSPCADIRIETELPRVLGNEIGLRQAFSNLLANAVKFVKPGKLPSVRIYAEPMEDRVRIWFQDNGVGIAPEFLSQLFHIFQRGTVDFPGTGLGLALVKRVIERMGGQVGVESESGKGSRFWVELKTAESQRMAA